MESCPTIDKYENFNFLFFSSLVEVVQLSIANKILRTGEGKVFMLGGARHGVLGDPEKTPSTTDVRGITESSYSSCSLHNFVFQYSSQL